MSRTYRATGINLKSMPLGEHDRILTILTREQGLIRAVAPGSRKPKSKLGGRSALFVVNDLLMARGKSLDRISQAETVKSYTGLSRNFGILTASQYLAEIVLAQNLSDRPQAELFALLTEHLDRLEGLPKDVSLSQVLSHLCHGVFHLLALEGIAPQVHACCLSQHPMIPDVTRRDWQVGFSVRAGGVVTLAEFERLKLEQMQQWKTAWEDDGEAAANRAAFVPTPNRYLNATELTLLQQLSQPELSPTPPSIVVEPAWIALERLLREYTQHHLGRSIRSATLMNSYIASRSTAIQPTRA
ncbi:MAG: DNA repair protein RecO [Cyanobacteria bacterium SID2]|nr:DNA repair protein RecO [Cyanobacteria bacterium SID2]MBP0003690.1 DNA repair protein RecO [Cyanobacteria bacterium SBC]